MALAERLARLLADPQARADLAGRERAASLSWEAMAVRLEEVYLEARADRRARIGSGS